MSHRLNEVYEISDRIIVMRSGEVVAYRRFTDLEHGELVGLIVGHDISNPSFAPPSEQFQLKLRGVRIGYLGPICLSVSGGEVLALCGLCGAEQNAIGRAIAGAVPPRPVTWRSTAPRSPHAAP